MGVYKITNVGANKCLNIFGSNITPKNLADGRQITIWTDTGSAEQHWICPALNTAEYLRSYVDRSFGLNAYNPSASKSNCTLHKIEGNETDAQLKLEHVTGTRYRICLKNYSNKYLTVDSSQDNASVFWTSKDTSNNYQVWEFSLQSIIASDLSAIIYAIVGTSANPLPTAQMEANADYIYDFLREKGFTKEAACAVLGNFQHESCLNPGVWNKLNNVSTAYGIAQFYPASRFLTWATDVNAISAATADTVNTIATNSPRWLMATELAFFLWDCEVNASFAVDETWDYDTFKASTDTPENLAQVFCENYERSGATTFTERQTYARNWYNYFS